MEAFWFIGQSTTFIDETHYKLCFLFLCRVGIDSQQTVYGTRTGTQEVLTSPHDLTSWTKFGSRMKYHEDLCGDLAIFCPLYCSLFFVSSAISTVMLM
jgi:hypothetical protein